MVEDVDIERRSVSELLHMVAPHARQSLPSLIDLAGGLERLSRADPLEIAAHLDERRAGDVEASRRRGRRPTPSALRSAHAVAAAFELGRRAEIARAMQAGRLGSAAEVAAWAAPRLASLAHEELWMLGLDARGHLRGARCVARGGLHGAAVRASDPLRAALRVDASAFVLVHNHPCGDPTPSKEDIALTAQVADAAEVAGLVLLDHVVVARGTFACVPLPAKGPAGGGQ